ncbi:hypothetical protein E2C01_000435 [Portunus trituberculatus]|uniref:Uncharacterized protein n=1 Tax=Portunus trituberculatus TaxID=210409 RepID=A0A5B7CEN5_PORTR|nr:hypothetical protein [Portunus trituberculatus]
MTKFSAKLNERGIEALPSSSPCCPTPQRQHNLAVRTSLPFKRTAPFTSGLTPLWVARDLPQYLLRLVAAGPKGSASGPRKDGANTLKCDGYYSFVSVFMTIFSVT